MTSPPGAANSGSWLISSPKSPSNVGRLAANLGLIALIAVIAAIIGLLPALLFARNAYITATAITIAAAFAFVTVLRIRPTHLEMATLPEFAAVGLAAISQGAVVSFLALSFYAAVTVTHFIGDKVIGVFGYRFISDWTSVAAGFGIVIGIVTLPGLTIQAVKGIMQAMFPPVAGYPTPYWKWARSPWKSLLVIALAVIALALPVLALLGFFSPASFLSYLIVSFVLVGATASAWTTGQTQTASRHFTNVEGSIGAMLRAMEFAVVEQPRTGSPQHDPYLADIDFGASKDGRNFVLLIKEYNERALPNVHDVSSVSFAADALSDALTLDPTLRFSPVLVAIGDVATEQVEKFARYAGVAVISVPDRTRLLSAGPDPADLRAKGTEIFRELLAPRDASGTGSAIALKQRKQSYSASMGSGA